MSLYLSSGLHKNRTAISQRRPRYDWQELAVSQFGERPSLFNGARISEETRQTACDRLGEAVTGHFHLVLLMIAKDALYLGKETAP